jgi:hypothetical protein
MYEVDAGETVTIAYDLLGGLSGSVKSFESVSPSVATVTAGGVVSGVSAGTAVINVTVGGITKSVTVKVISTATTGFVIDNKTSYLAAGSAADFHITPISGSLGSLNATPSNANVTASIVGGNTLHIVGAAAAALTDGGVVTVTVSDGTNTDALPITVVEAAAYTYFDTLSTGAIAASGASMGGAFTTAGVDGTGSGASITANASGKELSVGLVGGYAALYFDVTGLTAKPYSVSFDYRIENATGAIPILFFAITGNVVDKGTGHVNNGHVMQNLRADETYHGLVFFDVESVGSLGNNFYLMFGGDANCTLIIDNIVIF